MNTIQPYPQACVKCGAPEAANSGYSLSLGAAWGSHGIGKRWCQGEECQAVDLTGVDPRDHLDRICKDCGYAWAEPCKDAKP